MDQWPVELNSSACARVKEGEHRLGVHQSVDLQPQPTCRKQGSNFIVILPQGGRKSANLSVSGGAAPLPEPGWKHNAYGGGPDDNMDNGDQLVVELKNAALAEEYLKLSSKTRCSFLLRIASKTGLSSWKPARPTRKPKGLV